MGGDVGREEEHDAGASDRLHRCSGVATDGSTSDRENCADDGDDASQQRERTNAPSGADWDVLGCPKALLDEQGKE